MAHTTTIHPGLVLLDELAERGLTQSALARHIGVLPKTINEICRGKRGISGSMSMKLAQALGASPQFWLNLQTAFDLKQAEAEVGAQIMREVPQREPVAA